MAWTPEAEPGDIGLDAGRLLRLERHLTSYVERATRAGMLIAISRGGKLGYMHATGWRDREAELPVTADTVWRLYSMTKPLTSAAALSLCEEGRLRLEDPVHRFIPAFAEVRVLDPASTDSGQGVPVREPVRVHHLLTHTSGLTYPFYRRDAADEAYRTRLGDPRRYPSLEAYCEALAGMPLVSDPGTAWNYSVSTDVLGRVVEIAAGKPLDLVLEERILGPLGMCDTGFAPPDRDGDRLATLYADVGGRLVPATEASVGYSPYPQGGTGLYSTARDYTRFLGMLRGRGALDGVRVLAPSTVRLMTINHLPQGMDIPTFARPSPLASTLSGHGFGLGFAVLTDPARARTIASVGEFSWGGAAGTEFWIDPAEDLSVLFLTQVIGAPDEHPLRRALRWLVYQALVG